jgi:hypothetical protein
MPAIKETKTFNMTQELLEGMDMANELDYYMKNAVEYMSRGIKGAVEQKRKTALLHQAEKEALIAKYEGITNVKKLQTITMFSLQNKLLEARGSQFDMVLMGKLETLYHEYQKIAEQNEIIILHNTEVIDAVVKTMTTAGIEKVIYKFKSARSSVKVAVDAEWWKELKENYVSKYYTSYEQYTKKKLDEVYNQILIEKATFDAANLKAKQEHDAIAEKEAKAVKAKQQEAILIAHTCIRFNFDIAKVTNIQELDQALIQIGEIPSSVLDALKKELSF